MMGLKEFLETYEKSGISRFHMPGHKGDFPLLAEHLRLSYDITEVMGADVLFQSDGVLKELEDRIAAFYGAGGTAVSTGGSTLCIQAMLAAAFRPGDCVIAARNAHTAFINACILLDLRPIWLYPEQADPMGISGAVTPAQVQETLAAYPAAKGVYLTSPDYFGTLTDIQSISKLCHQSGKRLLVDNAHGAALCMAEQPLHPILCGADLCCDSAHKTLPVLTGGAFLHYSSAFSAEIKEKMALFGSTSPSYLTLLSIDLCLRWLKKEGKAAYRETAKRVEMAKAFCAQHSVPCHTGGDPFRLSVRTGGMGYSDAAAGAHFRSCQIEPEFVGGGYVVLMASPFNREEDWERLSRALKSLTVREPDKGTSLRPEKPAVTPVPCEGTIPPCGDAVSPREGAALSCEGVISPRGGAVPPYEDIVLSCGGAALPHETALTPRKAAFSPSETIPTEGAAGRIAAQTVIKCPPGVPVVIPGEKITPQAEFILKNSGNLTVKVIK